MAARRYHISLVTGAVVLRAMLIGSCHDPHRTSPRCTRHCLAAPHDSRPERKLTRMRESACIRRSALPPFGQGSNAGPHGPRKSWGASPISVPAQTSAYAVCGPNLPNQENSILFFTYLP